MPDALIHFRVAVTAIIALIHPWAIVSVFRRDKSLPGKIRWMLSIGLLPVPGLIIWGFAGPCTHDGGLEYAK